MSPSSSSSSSKNSFHSASSQQQKLEQESEGKDVNELNSHLGSEKSLQNLIDDQESHALPENQKLIQEFKNLLKTTSSPNGNENVLDYYQNKRKIGGFPTITDEYLFKFIIARGKDLEKGKNMFVSTMEWRVKKNVDQLPYSTILIANHVRGLNSLSDQNFNVYADEGVPEGWSDILELLGGGCYHKWDKSGVPIYIDRMGKVNAKKIANCNQEKLIDYHLCNLEFMIKKIMPEYSQRAGRVIDKHTVIMDLSGLGFSHLNIKALQIFKSLADIDQNYYPELIHRVFVINAPYIFTKIWSIIKIWIDKKTQEKVHIHGSDYKDKLLEYIDADCLPAIYGGGCTCSHMKTGCVPKMAACRD